MDHLVFKNKVAGHTVNVLYGEQAVSPDAFGSWNWGPSEIRISANTTTKNQFATYVHELLEALNEIYAIKLEHRQIEALETGIFAYLTDNRIIPTNWSFRDFATRLFKARARKKIQPDPADGASDKLPSEISSG